MGVFERGISQSGLSIFRDCPYAYKLRYMDNAEGMFFDPSVLDVGKLAHKAIELYYKHDFLTEGTADDILALTYLRLKNIWDITLTIEQLQKAYQCLENHAAWEASNIEKYNNAKPLTEAKLAGRNYFGYVDYINLNQNQAIDFKTNTWPTLSYEYRMQAHVYRELIEKNFDVTLSHFYFFFLYPNTWRTVKFDSDKQKKVGEEVEEMKRQVLACYENGGFEKRPRTPATCKNCLYNYYCMLKGW